VSVIKDLVFLRILPCHEFLSFRLIHLIGAILFDAWDDSYVIQICLCIEIVGYKDFDAVSPNASGSLRSAMVRYEMESTNVIWLIVIQKIFCPFKIQLGVHFRGIALSRIK